MARPPISAHISDDWPFLKYWEKKISNPHFNSSGYLRELVERDLSNQPVDVNPVAPDVLVFLTRKLLGDLDAAEMERLLSGTDQPRRLQHMLREFIHDERQAARQLVMAAEPTLEEVNAQKANDRENDRKKGEGGGGRSRGSGNPPA